MMAALARVDVSSVVRRQSLEMIEILLIVPLNLDSTNVTLQTELMRLLVSFEDMYKNWHLLFKGWVNLMMNLNDTLKAL